MHVHVHVHVHAHVRVHVHVAWNGFICAHASRLTLLCETRRSLVQGEHEKALRRAVTKAEAASARERDALTRAAAREKAALLRYAERADGQVRP